MHKRLPGGHGDYPSPDLDLIELVSAFAKRLVLGSGPRSADYLNSGSSTAELGFERADIELNRSIHVGRNAMWPD